MSLVRWLRVGAEPEDFRVTGYGLREVMPSGLVRRQAGTNDFLIMFFYEPTMIGVGGELIETGPGTLICWDKGASHHYGDSKGPWSHSWLHCDGTLVSELCRELEIPLNIPVEGAQAADFELLLSDLHRELSEYAHPDERIARNLFENWVRRFTRQALLETKGEQPKDSLMIQVRNHLDAQFGRKHSLKTLSRRFHLSTPHLSACFRSAFGQSPIDYLIQVRHLHAQHLLSSHATSIAEIAELVGYESPHHFSRMFKKHVGMSPREYRKMTLGGTLGG